MTGKKLITLGYILVFWGVLPGILAALAAWGERAFGPALRLPTLLTAGLLLAGLSGIMLALSIVQYTRAAGSLPISALPSPAADTVRRLRRLAPSDLSLLGVLFQRTGHDEMAGRFSSGRLPLFGPGNVHLCQDRGRRPQETVRQPL